MFIRPVRLMGDQECLKAVKCAAGRTSVLRTPKLVQADRGQAHGKKPYCAKAYQGVLSKRKGATKGDLHVKRIGLLWWHECSQIR